MFYQSIVEKLKSCKVDTSVIVLLSFAPRGPTMQFLLEENLIDK